MKHIALANHLAKGLAILSVSAISVCVQAEPTASNNAASNNATGNNATGNNATGNNTTGNNTTGNALGSDIANRCVFFDKIHFTAKVSPVGIGGTNTPTPNITPTDFDVKVLDNFGELADLKAKVVAKLDEICGNTNSSNTSSGSDQCSNIDRTTIEIKDVALAVHCVGNIANQTGASTSTGAL